MKDFLISIFDLFVDGSLLDDLIKENLVISLSLTLFLMPLFIAIIYYYVINSVRFAKKRHWGLMGFLGFILMLIVGFSTCSSMAGRQIEKDTSNPKAGFLFSQGDAIFILFGIQMAFFTIILFCIFSFSIKWGSSNCRRTPF